MLPVLELLKTAGHSPMDQTTLGRLLRYPWCWPAEEAAAERAGEFARPPRPAPSPGEVLLLAVTREAEAVGTLWRLGFSGGGPGLAASLSNALTRKLRILERQVQRDLPLLARTRQPTAREPSVELIEGDYAPVLDGDSYAGSILLAHASLLMNQPVPTDLAASMGIDAQGNAIPVRGLSGKLEALRRWAPGVTRVCIALNQAAEARELLGAASGLEIAVCLNSAQLLQTAFPDVSPPEWKDPRSRRAAADGLFALCLHGAPLLGWRCVERAAEVLKSYDDLEPTGRERLTFIERIAIRHDPRGRQVPTLSWPSEPALRGLTRPARYSFQANVLQQAPDSGDDSLGEVLSRLRLPEVEDHCRDSLKLAGTAARSLARLRRYDEARSLLQQTVEAWNRSYLPSESSFALSELYRVLGIQRDAEAISGLAHSLPDEVFDPASLAYVRLARGRALTQIQRWDDALLNLGEFDAPAPPHVEAARLRWQARCFAGLQRLEEAREARQLLRQQSATEADAAEQLLLAELDAGIESGVDPSPAVEAIQARSSSEVALLIAGRSPAELLTIFREEYPY